MTPIVVDVAQRSPAWHAARCGRLTGTAAADMLATIKSGEAAARRDLRLRLVVERLTGRPQDSGFTSADMQWGLDHEADARRAYESAAGEVVRDVGFLQHPELLAGCSPDGLIAAGGLLEIKCPRSAQHLRSLRAPDVLPEYRAQIVHNVWIAGAAWCDFVSFDPRFPAAGRLAIRRVVVRDHDRAAYELMARVFLREVDSEFADVQTLLAPRVAA
jgi:hypothetical protein